MFSHLISPVIFILICLSLLLIEGIGFDKAGASCNSNEYCPLGWSVLRRQEDYSAYTCNPTIKTERKCPKPHICVASKCGINFCCVNDKMLSKLEEKEVEEDEDLQEEKDENELNKKEF